MRPKCVSANLRVEWNSAGVIGASSSAAHIAFHAAAVDYLRGKPYGDWKLVEMGSPQGQTLPISVLLVGDTLMPLARIGSATSLSKFSRSAFESVPCRDTSSSTPPLWRRHSSILDLVRRASRLVILLTHGNNLASSSIGGAIGPASLPTWQLNE